AARPLHQKPIPQACRRPAVVVGGERFGYDRRIMSEPLPSSTPPPDPVPESALPWYRTISREQWKVLLAAKLGWMLDAMDFLLYVMAIARLKAYFNFGDDTAGLLGTITLLASAAGGLLFGLVADRLGRTRALMATILIFSLCSLGAATS